MTVETHLKCILSMSVSHYFICS